MKDGIMSHGCRRWFNMARDTSNDKIHFVYKIGEMPSIIMLNKL